MEWDELRFFLATVRGGSLSAAGRELNVNYTTVGRRLAELQRRLGTTLIRRTPEGLKLTAPGESIKSLCESMETAAIEVERRAAGQDRKPSGLVRLTATETLASTFLIPAIAALRVRYPEIEIELLPDYRLLDLSRRQADIALRNARPSDPRLVCRRLGGFALCLYASREYLSRRPAPRRGAGLAGHDLVAWAYVLPQTGAQFMGESIDGARIVFRSNSTIALVRAVAEGFGIGFLPRYLADRDPRLLRLWPEAPSAMQRLFLIYHSDLRRAGRVRVVAEAIAAALRHNARLLHG